MDGPNEGTWLGYRTFKNRYVRRPPMEGIRFLRGHSTEAYMVCDRPVWPRWVSLDFVPTFLCLSPQILWETRMGQSFTPLPFRTEPEYISVFPFRQQVKSENVFSVDPINRQTGTQKMGYSYKM